MFLNGWKLWRKSGLINLVSKFKKTLGSFLKPKNILLPFLVNTGSWDGQNWIDLELSISPPPRIWNLLNQKIINCSICILFQLSPVSEVSREMKNCNRRKNTHPSLTQYQRFVCLYVCYKSNFFIWFFIYTKQNTFSTSSLISPSFQGDPTICH